MDANEPIDPIEYEDDFEDFEDFDEYEDDMISMLPNPAVEAVENTLENFLAAATVDAVYGDPVEQGTTVIIPAAEIISVLGFGAGYGGGESSDAETGNGGGGGGGGRVFARPVAVVIATPEGVRVEPVIDITKIVVTFITALTFLLGMRVRFSRMRRTLENVE